MYWHGLPLVIFGSGGISTETLHIVEEINNANKIKVFNFLGFVENSEELLGKEVTKGYKVISTDNKFTDFVREFKVIGAVVPIGIPKVKKFIYDKLRNIENLVFPNIVHPNVTMDISTVTLGVGNVIASGSKLTNDIEIGNFNLINLNCTVGHNTLIKDFNVINPLVAVSGSVSIGNCCLIGTGANILQQLTIDNNVTVGAGSVVTKNISENETVVGIPAKRLEKR